MEPSVPGEPGNISNCNAVSPNANRAGRLCGPPGWSVLRALALVVIREERASCSRQPLRGERQGDPWSS